MLPWNYGFHWNTGTIIFMGAFYTVLAIVAGTVMRAALRAWRVMRAEKAEQVRWHSDFHDMSPANKLCRHALTGELTGRECPNGFDCRKCETHAKLMAGAERRPAEVEDDLFGLPFPADRLYHRGHTWVHLEPDGTLTIGLDEIGRRLVANPESIDLPQTGRRVRVNGTAWRARKRNANVRILSPVDGEIVATGGLDRAWMLKVKPMSNNLRHLLAGPEVKPWVMRELERLQLVLSAQGAAPALADGGVPVEDIAASYPETDWDLVCGYMFLHP